MELTGEKRGVSAVIAAPELIQGRMSMLGNKSRNLIFVGQVLALLTRRCNGLAKKKTRIRSSAVVDFPVQYAFCFVMAHALGAIQVRN